MLTELRIRIDHLQTLVITILTDAGQQCSRHHAQVANTANKQNSTCLGLLAARISLSKLKDNFDVWKNAQQLE